MMGRTHRFGDSSSYPAKSLFLARFIAETSMMLTGHPHTPEVQGLYVTACDSQGTPADGARNCPSFFLYRIGCRRL